MKQLIFLGILLIFLGVIVIIIGSLTGLNKENNVKVGVGGFIGFIPFGFANDKRILYFFIGLAFLMLIWILLNFPR